MTKYQSEILVPYLKDIFALHLALNKLQEQLIALVHEKCSLQEKVQTAEAPMQPRYEAGNGVFLLGLGMFTFMFSFIAFLHRFPFIGFLFILFGVMAIVIGGIQYVRVNQANAKKEEQYNEKLAVYQQLQTKNSIQNKAISTIDTKMRECQNEIEKVWNALRRLYRVNVIPKPYRNMDTAVFLYQRFGTGSSEDLNTALEHASAVDKEKVEQIISEQREQILQQYLQLAEQRKTPLVQEAYTLLMKSKLDQMELTAEDRKTHLAMINSNRAAVAYFAEAKCIRNP